MIIDFSFAHVHKKVLVVRRNSDARILCILRLARNDRIKLLLVHVTARVTYNRCT